MLIAAYDSCLVGEIRRVIPLSFALLFIVEDMKNLLLTMNIMVKCEYTI